MKNEFHICFVKYFFGENKIEFRSVARQADILHIMFCLPKVTKIFKIYCFFLSSLFFQDENMRRGKTKAKMKNVSDTWEHSNIFGSNIPNIKGSDLNYFAVFCLNFIMNSQIPLKSSQLFLTKLPQAWRWICLSSYFMFCLMFDVRFETYWRGNSFILDINFLDKEKYQTLSWNKKYCAENWKSLEILQKQIRHIWLVWRTRAGKKWPGLVRIWGENARNNFQFLQKIVRSPVRY